MEYIKLGKSQLHVSRICMGFGNAKTGQHRWTVDEQANRRYYKMAIKQTAGSDQLGDFAPKFAQLNDDVLFGEVWNRTEQLSLRDRSLVTVVSLMAMGLTDSSFQYHLLSAKANGITKEEIAEIITHAAFYVGWPKAWAVFRMAKEIWTDDAESD